MTANIGYQIFFFLNNFFKIQNILILVVNLQPLLYKLHYCRFFWPCTFCHLHHRVYALALTLRSCSLAIMLMFSTPEITHGKHHIFCILMEVLAYKLVYLLDVNLRKSQKLDLKLLIPHNLNIFVIKPKLII